MVREASAEGDPQNTDSEGFARTQSGDLKRLKNEIRQLGRKLEKRERDQWDKLGTILPFVSALLIAGIGAWATYNYNERQLELNSRKVDAVSIQTVEKLFPHLTSEPNSAERRAAILAIRALGMGNLAVQLAETFGGDGGVSALHVMALDNDPNVKQLATLALDRVADPRDVVLDAHQGRAQIEVDVAQAEAARYDFALWSADRKEWTRVGEGANWNDANRSVDLGPVETLSDRILSWTVVIVGRSDSLGTYSVKIVIKQGEVVWERSFDGDVATKSTVINGMARLVVR